MTSLQWYNYKFVRLIFKHHKSRWHLYYLVTPVVLYFAGFLINEYIFVLFVPYLIAFVIWYRSLDKKLIFTDRVKRFFIFLSVAVIVFDLICYVQTLCDLYCMVIPLVIAFSISYYHEKRLYEGFYLQAMQKLATMPNLKVISITASYGKTSMKNFTYDILSKHFRTYATPRSVNTVAGIMRDINESLDRNTEFYIVEAGAREKGDIKAITDLVNHTYAVVGKVGPAHIEYFGSMENIIATKLEILESKFLKKAFVQNDLQKNPLLPRNMSISYFPKEIKNFQSTLEGLCFDMRIKEEWYSFKAPILGKINIENIVAAIEVALEFGIPPQKIVEDVTNLKPVPHRLHRIDAGGKIIIDDSFNGNFEGVSAAIELAAQHTTGKKVIVTPGLVESTDELNQQIAQKIDQVFDLVIITGELNYKLYSETITHAQKIILKEKDLLQNILATHTTSGDLVLFANDAPSYI
jgi:UDP-N-acetylmuramoyl-tripeptide--D-alanyl-D-alanine ligase